MTFFEGGGTLYGSEKQQKYTNLFAKIIIQTIISVNKTRNFTLKYHINNEYYSTTLTHYHRTKNVPYRSLDDTFTYISFTFYLFTDDIHLIFDNHLQYKYSRTCLSESIKGCKMLANSKLPRDDLCDILIFLLLFYDLHFKKSKHR